VGFGARRALGMMREHGGLRIGTWGFILVSAFLISGCATLVAETDDPSAETAVEDTGPTPIYYDFGDVLIPSELKLQKKHSFVLRTPGLSSGVLSFKGRVEVNSLIAFFESNMSKDNWKPITSFKSPRTIMLYQKENRWCVISIIESDFHTNVEIYVAPTAGEAGDRVLK